jgi:hypothetical protein
VTNYLDSAVDSEQIAQEYEKKFRFRGLIVGPSKTGKSTLFAATAPGRKLIIDAENRYHNLIYPNVKIIPVLDLASSQSIKPGMSIQDISEDSQIRAWNILLDINNELWYQARANKLEEDSLGIDGLSALNRLAMAFVLSLKRKANGEEVATGLAGAPAQHHFGPQMHILSMLLFSLSALPMHFVLNGHMDYVEDKKRGETAWFPRMYGKTRHEIGSWYDECYESERTVNVASGEQIYRLRTIGYANKQFLGSSMNTEGRYWQSPFRVDLSESPAGIEKLIQLRFGDAVKGGDTSAKGSLGSSLPNRVVLQPGGARVGADSPSSNVPGSRTGAGGSTGFKPGVGTTNPGSAS